jgi:membrane-bound lytic murein transglycosylase B
VNFWRIIKLQAALALFVAAVAVPMAQARFAEPDGGPVVPAQQAAPYTKQQLEAMAQRYQAQAQFWQTATDGTSVRPDDRAGTLGIGTTTSTSDSPTTRNGPITSARSPRRRTP